MITFLIICIGVYLTADTQTLVWWWMLIPLIIVINLSSGTRYETAEGRDMARLEAKKSRRLTTWIIMGVIAFLLIMFSPAILGMLVVLNDL